MAGRDIVAETQGPLSRLYLFSDFLNIFNGSVFANASNGTNAANFGSSAVVAGRPGEISSETGSTNAGRAGGQGTGTALVFSGGEWVYETDIFINTLSDGTDTYVIYIGFIDQFAGAESTDGAYFKYEQTTSANWIMTTASNGSRTSTPSSVAVVAGAWIRLKIVVNAAGTSVEYFVNGASIGTVTGTIPVTTARATSIGWMIIKSVGGSSRILRTDWVAVSCLLTTPR